jgi:hypothetical protein
MKCVKCGGFDSYTQFYYVDRNGDYFNESEHEAFRILHPYAKVIFKKELICGVCSVGIIRKKRLGLLK